LEDGPILNKSFIIQILESYEEQNKKTKEITKKQRVFGQSMVKMRTMLDRATTQILRLNLRGDGNKSVGVLELRNSSLRNFHTFIDLHVKNALNLVPIVAVDFSLANLTFDENQYCIHTLKPGVPNDYVEALRRIASGYKYFSKFMLAYGFGARTCDIKEGPACNLFSMTGDFMDPYVGTEEELINSY
jgi:hypothetical protein